MGKDITARWQHVTDVVSRVSFPGYEFSIQGWVSGLVTLRVEYQEKDVMTGIPETQHGRRWIIEDDATDMAIIQTCFKALLTSLEHRAREHFTFEGRALLQPHYSLAAMLNIAPERRVDADALELEPV